MVYFQYPLEKEILENSFNKRKHLGDENKGIRRRAGKKIREENVNQLTKEKIKRGKNQNVQ